MPQCRITVLKKLFYEDLAKEYCRQETAACDLFEVGQQFVAKHSMKEPEGFPCSGAFRGLGQYCQTVNYQ